MISASEANSLLSYATSKLDYYFLKHKLTLTIRRSMILILRTVEIPWCLIVNFFVTESTSTGFQGFQKNFDWTLSDLMFR